MSKKILIVDDERNIRRTLGMILSAEGYDIRDAESGETALESLAAEGADLVVLDVKLPGIDGIEVLRRIKEADPDQAAIMISGHGNIQTAVEATREGAFDFLEKPLTKERVLVAVANALKFSTMGREWRELRAAEDERYRMVGDSRAMKRVRDDIARAAPSTARILILGESGTGKELIARSIHEASDRASGPFVKVNCAAIPEELIESELFGAVKGAYTGADSSRDGKFLQADGGTIFLDEIGDMSAKAQAKVLRVLQEGEVEKVGGSTTAKIDARVIAATNKDVAAEVAAGRFREDLFFRLNVVPIHAPPLREREGDVALLASHFLDKYRRDNNRAPARFTEDAALRLKRLPWPGNVRELQNVVERLAIMARGPDIDPTDLAAAGVGGGAPAAESRAASGPAALTPEGVQELGGLVEARRHFEAEIIRACLKETGGNVSAAARLLGIERTNLHKKIQSYGLDPDREKSGNQE